MAYTIGGINCSTYQCNNCLGCPTGCAECETTDGCNVWSTCRNPEADSIRGNGRGPVRSYSRPRYAPNGFGRINPANKSSYGFTNNYDGRIRGGIKTNSAFIKQRPGRAFDIMSSNG